MNRDAVCMKESCHLELKKIKENNSLNKPLITL